MHADSENKFEVRNLVLLCETELSMLAQLKVSDWQAIKGGSFQESVEAWQKDTTGLVLGLSFLIENRFVGMTLFKRPPLSPSWVSNNAATIHGLKISIPWQGRGLGHKALSVAVAQLKEQWPTITSLMLAVDADNAAALAVYRAFGMTDSGPIHEGNHGLEHRFEISLLP